MDGEVALESEEGEGTAVFVSLRMTIVAETRGREAEFFLETSFPRSRPLRLVVAEDNPVNSALLQKVLHSHGHSCTVVTNGRELMELRDRDGFDAVFMDIQMPEMDGLEAAALIRKGGTSLLPPDIPIVAVTAHAMPEERSRIFQAGMNYFLEKPVSLDALDRVLGKLSGTDISSRDSTVQSE
jgi:CheY-like chemotaxis protein